MQNYGTPTSLVKGLVPGKYQVNVHEKFEEKIARLLKEAPVDPSEAIYYTNCKRSTVYAWYATGKIPFSALVIIAMLAATRGYYELHQLMLPEGMTITLTGSSEVDGSLHDNLARFMPCFGESIRDFERGDYKHAKQSLVTARAELDAMEAEINAKLQ